MGTQSEKLEELLGFKLQSGNIQSNVLAEVAKEIAEEKIAKAKSGAKTLMLQAIAKHEAMEELKKRFAKELAGAEKELGKLIKQLQKMVSGESGDDSENEDEQH